MENRSSEATATRAAVYLRVSTGRQAEHDLSIPDQRRQIQSYCLSKGLVAVAEFVEPGASATDDRRPEFQRMMDEAQRRPSRFDVIVVHSFSRFFRDQFQLEFYVRKLAKNCVRLISITQDLGDDPMSVMMRQIMALFDEYQSKENAKHTLRAMRENARQGFWNGSRPPYGYRTVDAEQRGTRMKKRIEPDPLTADKVRTIFRLARFGDGEDGPMGSRRIADYLNSRGLRTSTGGRWGAGAIHDILTRETYIGKHRFNVYSWRKKVAKPDDEVVEVDVPPIVEREEFEEVQALLRRRCPQLTAPRFVNGTMLLGGVAFCARCGAAMTQRTGKYGRYRYYACSNRQRRGEFGCAGMSIPAGELDECVVAALETRLLRSERLREILDRILANRTAALQSDQLRIQALRSEAAEADRGLIRLYDAIAAGVADPADSSLRNRLNELRAIRDGAQADADRAAHRAPSSIEVTQSMVDSLATEAQRRLRKSNGKFRRHYIQAVAKRVDVSADEIKVCGGVADLLKTLAQPGQASSGMLASAPKVLGFDPKWLPGPDSNRRPSD